MHYREGPEFSESVLDPFKLCSAEITYCRQISWSHTQFKATPAKLVFCLQNRALLKSRITCWNHHPLRSSNQKHGKYDPVFYISPSSCSTSDQYPSSTEFTLRNMFMGVLPSSFPTHGAFSCVYPTTDHPIPSPHFGLCSVVQSGILKTWPSTGPHWGQPFDMLLPASAPGLQHDSWGAQWHHMSSISQPNPAHS